MDESRLVWLYQYPRTEPTEAEIKEAKEMAR